MDLEKLRELCKLIRYDIVTATTEAGSGHPTSSLSAVELMTALFFGGFLRYDLKNPHNISNDRVIFSKGHASPLLYSLYHAAGEVTYEELMKLRKFSSPLEGHPTPHFRYADVATGSLGQGLSIGVGMALGIRKRVRIGEISSKRIPKVWVLLGDSEMAEGQIWEAINSASYFKLNNLVGILDVNRIGQTGETMFAWDTKKYEDRIRSFGWDTVVIENGHNLDEILKAFQLIDSPKDTKDQRPVMIIAKTVKGKGITFLEDKDGWHGKVIPKEKLQKALDDIGKVDKDLQGKITEPEKNAESINKLFQINRKLEKYAVKNTDGKEVSKIM